MSGAVVVAQLVERSHLTPKIRGLNPNSGKILSTNCTVKRGREWPILKNTSLSAIALVKMIHYHEEDARQQ